MSTLKRLASLVLVYGAVVVVRLLSFKLTLAGLVLSSSAGAEADADADAKKKRFNNIETAIMVLSVVT